MSAFGRDSEEEEQQPTGAATPTLTGRSSPPPPPPSSSGSSPKRRDRSRSDSGSGLSAAWPLTAIPADSAAVHHQQRQQQQQQHYHHMHHHGVFPTQFSAALNAHPRADVSLSGFVAQSPSPSLSAAASSSSSPSTVFPHSVAPLPPFIAPPSSSAHYASMSFPSSKTVSSAGDLAAAFPPGGTGSAAHSTGAAPAQSRRSGSMGVSPSSAGRSSSAGAHWGSGGFPHHQFQPPQPYPDHRSSSAALPLRHRLSDISESEDDTGDEDSPRTTTPPRARQRNKRAATARSGSADNNSGERPGQPQYFSRWKLNKSVIPPEIQAYTDQVRRQNLIIDDSRDGTGSSSSNSSSRPPKSTQPVKTEHSGREVPPITLPPPMMFPSGFGAPGLTMPSHPHAGRTSSLPAQVYLQYAGYAPYASVNPSSSPLTSTPSSPRASSAVVSPSWGMAPNPFFPPQTQPIGASGGTSQGTDLFYSPPQLRGGPFPPPTAHPSRYMGAAVPTPYVGPTITSPGQYVFQNASGPPLRGVSGDSLPPSQPISPRANSALPYAYGSSASVPPSSLEQLMREKLFALADVATVAAHDNMASKPLATEHMDVSSDDEDMSEASDDRSGGTRMQL